MRELDQGLGLTLSVAACFEDRRNPDLITHTVPELPALRLFRLALGSIRRRSKERSIDSFPRQCSCGR